MQLYRSTIIKLIQCHILRTIIPLEIDSKHSVDGHFVLHDAAIRIVPDTTLFQICQLSVPRGSQRIRYTAGQLYAVGLTVARHVEFAIVGASLLIDRHQSVCGHGQAGRPVKGTSVRRHYAQLARRRTEHVHAIQDGIGDKQVARSIDADSRTVEKVWRRRTRRELSNELQAVFAITACNGTKYNVVDMLDKTKVSACTVVRTSDQDR